MKSLPKIAPQFTNRSKNCVVCWPINSLSHMSSSVLIPIFNVWNVWNNQPRFVFKDHLCFQFNLFYFINFIIEFFAVWHKFINWANFTRIKLQFSVLVSVCHMFAVSFHFLFAHPPHKNGSPTVHRIFLWNCPPLITYC